MDTTEATGSGPGAPLLNLEEQEQVVPGNVKPSGIVDTGEESQPFIGGGKEVSTSDESPSVTPMPPQWPLGQTFMWTPTLGHRFDSSGSPGTSGYPASLMDKSETNSAIFSMCRICHMPGSGDDETDILISPCRCAGTLQFIHNTCLMKWLEITTKKSRKPPKCELCHFQYHRHKKFKFSHWRFPRVSKQDKVLHLIFIVNLLIMIGCAVATVMCFLSDKGQITKFPRNKVDLTTEEIITLSCGVLFFVSFFIAMSVQIKAKHTIYQLLVKFIMQNMEWEIDEYDKSKDALYQNKEPLKGPAEYV